MYLQQPRQAKVHSGSVPYVSPTSTVATACDVPEVESLGTPASTVPATTVAAGCGVLEVEPSDTPASTFVNVTNANEPTIVLAAFYGKRKATKTMDPHGEAITYAFRSVCVKCHLDLSKNCAFHRLLCCRRKKLELRKVLQKFYFTDFIRQMYQGTSVA